MTRLLVSLLALAIPLRLAATELKPVSYPQLPDAAASLAGFTPPGWSLEYEARGELDGDDIDDAVLVLRMRDPANVVANAGLGLERFDTNPRILAVVLGRDDGGYRLALQDHALIPRPDSPVMDDYLDGPEAITITSRRAFTVELYLWASAGTWSTSRTRFTFRLQDRCFRVIGYDHLHVHRGSATLDDLSVNYPAGRVKRSHESPETPRREHWSDFTRGPGPCLVDVGNGFEFDPGVPAP